MRCACVTGHRRLSQPEAVRRSLAAALEEALRDGYGRFFVGMALGADQMAAELLVGRAEVVAVLPCEDYDRLWPEEVREKYRRLMGRVSEVVCYPGGPYAPWKPHARNRWMVDRSHLVVAVYDGRRRGGMYRTLQYAGARGVPVRLVWG